jgi:hypothetical protein
VGHERQYRAGVLLSRQYLHTLDRQFIPAMTCHGRVMINCCPCCRRMPASCKRLCTRCTREVGASTLLFRRARGGASQQQANSSTLARSRVASQSSVLSLDTDLLWDTELFLVAAIILPLRTADFVYRSLCECAPGDDGKCAELCTLLPSVAHILTGLRYVPNAHSSCCAGGAPVAYLANCHRRRLRADGLTDSGAHALLAVLPRLSRLRFLTYVCTDPCHVGGIRRRAFARLIVGA